MEEPILRRINKAAPNDPFMSIVTRTFKKPKCLVSNIMSLERQTDQDYEQIFIGDNIGRGLDWADQALDTYKDINTGKYVMVLDDDDELTSRSFITTIKDIANRFNPDIIMWRGFFTEVQCVLPPIDPRWGVHPTRGLIGSFNYCTTRELYNKYIHLCKSGLSGDFDFIETVFNSTPKDKVFWLKKILVKTQQKSFGEALDIE